MIQNPQSILDVLSDPSQMHSFAESYNKKMGKVPRILTLLLGEEKVNIEIILNDGKEFKLGYRTDKGRITEIAEGWLKEPTIIVSTTLRAIERINASADPLAAFKKEKSMRGIVIEGQSLETRIKLNAALSSDKVLWFFYKTLFS